MNTKLATMGVLSLTIFLSSCAIQSPDKVIEVKGKDGKMQKLLSSDHYPAAFPIEQYPGSQLKACVRPADQPDQQPTITLLTNDDTAAIEQWYKSKLSEQGWQVQMANLGDLQKMIRATKGDDIVGVMIIGGIVQLNTVKKK